MTCLPLTSTCKCCPAPHGPGCTFAAGKVLIPRALTCSLSNTTRTLLRARDGVEGARARGVEGGRSVCYANTAHKSATDTCAVWVRWMGALLSDARAHNARAHKHSPRQRGGWLGQEQSSPLGRGGPKHCVHTKTSFTHGAHAARPRHTKTHGRNRSHKRTHTCASAACTRRHSLQDGGLGQEQSSLWDVEDPFSRG